MWWRDKSLSWWLLLLRRLGTKTMHFTRVDDWRVLQWHFFIIYHLYHYFWWEWCDSWLSMWRSTSVPWKLLLLKQFGNLRFSSKNSIKSKIGKAHRPKMSHFSNKMYLSQPQNLQSIRHFWRENSYIWKISNKTNIWIFAPKKSNRFRFWSGDIHLEMRCCKLSSQEITEIFLRSNSVKKRFVM